MSTALLRAANKTLFIDWQTVSRRRKLSNFLEIKTIQSGFPSAAKQFWPSVQTPVWNPCLLGNSQQFILRKINVDTVYKPGNSFDSALDFMEENWAQEGCSDWIFYGSRGTLPGTFFRQMCCAIKCLNHMSEKLQEKMFHTDYLWLAENGTFRDTPAVMVGHEVSLVLCCLCGHYVDQTAAGSTVSKTHWAILFPSLSLHPLPLLWKLRQNNRLCKCICVCVFSTLTL